MFCSKCGGEIMDEAVICPKCGCETGVKKHEEKEVDEPKTGMGILFALLLGLIGLAVGLTLYKENTIARKTFMKAWGITFGISMVVYVVAIILYVSSVNSMIESLYDMSDVYY